MNNLTCHLLLGIIDWGEVARHYGKVFKDHGGDIHLNFNVDTITEGSHGKAVRIQGKSPDQVSRSWKN